ncbi:hypothetical protein CYMTET_10207 [Cymbomonas tetramitiformis]|uniref:Amino acid transporter transmembrane domain-containing protein n=1 Tax=Cymbomonas tetramitiformis TaxID=36881 RepID=A0AAE0LE24_9CHLO|nr:hypothetical protein CYMTET_10207 [Cymbomonas tetramitiformis]
MCNAMLGSGVLGFPYCFKSCGVVLSVGLVFLVAFVTEMSLNFLLYCSELTGKRTYPSLAEASLGRKGELLVYLAIVLLQVSPLPAPPSEMPG